MGIYLVTRLGEGFAVFLVRRCDHDAVDLTPVEPVALVTFPHHPESIQQPPLVAPQPTVEHLPYPHAGKFSAGDFGFGDFLPVLLPGGSGLRDHITRPAGLPRQFYPKGREPLPRGGGHHHRTPGGVCPYRIQIEILQRIRVSTRRQVEPSFLGDAGQRLEHVMAFLGVVAQHQHLVDPIRGCSVPGAHCGAEDEFQIFSRRRLDFGLLPEQQDSPLGEIQPGLRFIGTAAHIVPLLPERFAACLAVGTELACIVIVIGRAQLPPFRKPIQKRQIRRQFFSDAQSQVWVDSGRSFQGTGSDLQQQGLLLAIRCLIRGHHGYSAVATRTQQRGHDPAQHFMATRAENREVRPVLRIPQPGGERVDRFGMGGAGTSDQTTQRRKARRNLREQSQIDDVGKTDPSDGHRLHPVDGQTRKQKHALRVTIQCQRRICGNANALRSGNAFDPLLRRQEPIAYSHRFDLREAHQGG